MASTTPRRADRVVRFTKGLTFCVFLLFSAAVQQTPGYADVLQPQQLSPEEYQEYTARVEEVRSRLQNEYRFLQAFGHQSPMLQRWLRTIDYVKGAQVAAPLFTSDPPQVRVRLQIELTSKTIVRDEVAFYLPIAPQIEKIPRSVENLPR
jgi:hypothetical protein